MIGTLAILKSDWLNVSGTSEDARLTRCMEQASQYIADVCQQPIEQTTVICDFTGRGATHTAIYYTVPVTLTTLQYRTNPTDTFTNVTGAVVYEVNALKYLYLDTGFGQHMYRATYSIGYASNAIPVTIQRAAYMLAKEIALLHATSPTLDRFGLASVITNDGVQTVTQVLKSVLLEVRAMLAPYTRVLP